jgi:formylglycine-generating enzyme required for sulfatase activity
VLRGGSFGDAAPGLRGADRHSGGPEFSSRYIGFRVVWSPAGGLD